MSDACLSFPFVLTMISQAQLRIKISAINFRPNFLTTRLFGNMPKYPGLGLPLRDFHQRDYGLYPMGMHGNCSGGDSDRGCFFFPRLINSSSRLSSELRDIIHILNDGRNSRIMLKIAISSYFSLLNKSQRSNANLGFPQFYPFARSL